MGAPGEPVHRWVRAATGVRDSLRSPVSMHPNLGDCTDSYVGSERVVHRLSLQGSLR